MRQYEVVYIFDPSLDEDAVSKKLERFHKAAAAPKGADLTAVDHWGVRQLAYPIRKQTQGYYVVAQFVTDPDQIPEFERVVRLDDDLMRFLVVLNEGEPTSGMSILAEGAGDRDEERDEDDEDEDEEEEEEGEEEEEYGSGAGSPPEFSGGRGRRRRVDAPAIETLNYKDVATLSRFVTEQGKILPRRTTKVPARFQRQLGKAVKRARYLALVPYVQSHDR